MYNLRLVQCGPQSLPKLSSSLLPTMIQGVGSGSDSGQGVLLMSVATQGATRCDLDGQSMSMDHEKRKKTKDKKRTVTG